MLRRRRGRKFHPPGGDPCHAYIMDDLRRFNKREGICWFGGFSSDVQDEDIHGSGELPVQDPGAVPVQHGHEIDKSMVEAYVGDIGTPDLVGRGDFFTLQQIGIYLMFRAFSRLVEIPFRVDCLSTYDPHQTLDPLPVNLLVDVFPT